jgi:dihydrofolate reductase
MAHPCEVRSDSSVTVVDCTSVKGHPYVGVVASTSELVGNFSATIHSLEQIKRLKEADGGDIMTFGIPTLVQSLTNAGLLDEYWILIHPVIVNEGKRLFANLEGRTDFRLISVDAFERGAILVKYARLGD